MKIKKPKAPRKDPAHRNAYATNAARRTGAGKHKDRRLRRTDRNSWRKELD